MADRPRGDGNTSTRDETVADYARREMAELEDRERLKKAYWEGQKRIVTEIPPRFVKLATDIRAEIDTFNKIVDATRRIALSESAGLATRADPAKAELNLTITRKGCEAWIGLSELMRLGRGPTAYIIEAHFKLSEARFRMRAEGIAHDGNLRYRVTVEGKEAPFGLDELATRAVLAIAKDDPELLGALRHPR